MTKITVPSIRTKYAEHENLVMVTAYDYTFARLVDNANVDIVLVGDSLGVTVQGRANTLAVTLDEMLYHTKIVARGVERALVVGDMPFMSYQTGSRDALVAAGRMLKEGLAEAVKLEGGKSIAPLVRRMVAAGIPVMGHVGLMPQSYHVMGGHKLQGKESSERERILDDAKALCSAGCFSIVLEGVPEGLGEEITKQLEIPTIGIGAGRYCSGQVLVINDLLGLKSDAHAHLPKFVKSYAALSEVVVNSVSAFAADVRAGNFPQKEHVYSPLARTFHQTP